ncbi:UNKNOWN [Stylonychia lemnae]|uniref:PH domain-containing protein n=1 Tax=Stylonychia lemnae TaxID=5949 RepID=A0A078AY79_STYLE|nr:UNKNOWN [Stylonychia lemnae]|eukprot:CDW86172.1 UNKNOWN [Stylonychia lemnae]
MEEDQTKRGETTKEGQELEEEKQSEVNAELIPPAIIENPKQKFTVNGVDFETSYFGPMVIQGYLKKLASGDSLFNENKFQRRFFMLNLSFAIFKYAKTPTAEFKSHLFKEIEYIVTDGPNMYFHKKYQFPFKVKCKERFYHLCAKTNQERQAWINGFNFLFEFRRQQMEKYQAVLPQTSTPLPDAYKEFLIKQSFAEYNDPELSKMESVEGLQKSQSLFKKLNLKPFFNMLVNRKKPELFGMGQTPNLELIRSPSKNTDNQADNYSQLELPAEVKEQLETINQIREQVYEEYKELEKKQEEFEKQKKEFLQFQIDETEKLIAEKKKFQEKKEKFRQEKHRYMAQLQTSNVNDVVISDIDKQGNNGSIANLKSIDQNQQISEMNANESPKFPRKRVIKKSVDRQSAKFPLVLNNQNALLSTQLKQKLKRNQQNQPGSSDAQESLDRQDFENRKDSDQGGNNIMIEDPMKIKTDVQQIENDLEHNTFSDQQMKTFSRKKVKVQRGKSTSNRMMVNSALDSYTLIGLNKNTSQNTAGSQSGEDQVQIFTNQIEQPRNESTSIKQNQDIAIQDLRASRAENKLIAEDIDNDGESSNLNTINLLRNRSSRKKKEEIIVDEDHDNIPGESFIEKNEPDLPKIDLQDKFNNVTSPEIKFIPKIGGGRSNSIHLAHLKSIVQPKLQQNQSMQPELINVEAKKINQIQSNISNMINGSTIDTLIERERDAQFIERLDKQNKINLKNGNTFLQKSAAINQDQNQDFNISGGIQLVNHNNYSQFYGSKANASNNIKQRNQFENSSYTKDNYITSPQKSRYSNHMPAQINQNNNWGNEIDEDIQTQKPFFNVDKSKFEQLQLINNQSHHSRQKDNDNGVQKSSSYQPIDPPKQDTVLESFDANWDDDLEASIKQAQKEQKGANFKTISSLPKKNKSKNEEFEEVWE